LDEDRGGTIAKFTALLIPLIALAISLAGCASPTVRAPAAPPSRSTSTDYIDIQAGWRLTVVTPILKSGGYALQSLRTTRSVGTTASGGDITLAAGPDLLGYEIAHYGVIGQGRGRVRVQFSSAQTFKDGKPIVQPHPTVPLFKDARRPVYLRVVYLVRLSHADHNMAVLDAKRFDALDALTRQVLADPTGACKPDKLASCSWIPEGMAVRPEMLKKVGPPKRGLMLLTSTSASA
jgi:hypothetical protein